MTKALRHPEGPAPVRPSPARIYDYMLSGSHHFDVDADAGERLLSVVPEIRDCAWSNRGFHQRAAAWIARKGVRQFLDIGSGLPTVGNTHEVVRQVIGDARVVYVDIDPMVAAYAEQLLAGDGGTRVITADLRDPGAVLADARLRELIDFSEPTGLLMTAVMHFVADVSDPWGLVARYVAALAPGSYLALSHATSDNIPPVAVQRAAEAYRNAPEKFYMRRMAEVERFFSGLELVAPYAGAAPALVHMGLWGCENPELADSDGSRFGYSGVARRP